MVGLNGNISQLNIFAKNNYNNNNNNNNNYNNNNNITNSTKPIIYFGIAGAYDRSLPALWVFIPLAMVVAVIVLNTIQIWCMKKKFQREFNPLLIIVMSLAVADLVAGVGSLLVCLLMTVERHAFKGNELLLYIIRLVLTFSLLYVRYFNNFSSFKKFLRRF